MLKMSTGDEITSPIVHILYNFYTLQRDVEIFICGISFTNFRSGIFCVIGTKTLHFHCFNKIKVGIVTSWSTAQVQQNIQMCHLHFKHYKFYFLHVPEGLNILPDESIHFFRLLQARNVCTICSSKSVLQTCIKNMLKLHTLILTMVFLNVTLPVMFSMTKLIVKMLKKKQKNNPVILRISLYDFSFSQLISVSTSVFFFFFIPTLHLWWCKIFHVWGIWTPSAQYFKKII